MSQVCCGAKLQCSFGTNPCVLIVPFKLTKVGKKKKPAATIFDMVPGINIAGFGFCLGSVPSGSCSPTFVTPWLSLVPSITQLDEPLLDQTAKLICIHAFGLVSIADTGQDLTRFSPGTVI